MPAKDEIFKILEVQIFQMLVTSVVTARGGKIQIPVVEEWKFND